MPAKGCRLFGIDLAPEAKQGDLTNIMGKPPNNDLMDRLSHNMLIQTDLVKMASELYRFVHAYEYFANEPCEVKLRFMEEYYVILKRQIDGIMDREEGSQSIRTLILLKQFIKKCQEL